jgi:hypothetical protein
VFEVPIADTLSRVAASIDGLRGLAVLQHILDVRYILHIQYTAGRTHGLLGLYLSLTGAGVEARVEVEVGVEAAAAAEAAAVLQVTVRAEAEAEVEVGVEVGVETAVEVGAKTVVLVMVGRTAVVIDISEKFQRQPLQDTPSTQS